MTSRALETSIQLSRGDRDLASESWALKAARRAAQHPKVNADERGRLRTISQRYGTPAIVIEEVSRHAK